MEKSKAMPEPSILEKITLVEALEILSKLSKSDAQIAKQIEQLFLEEVKQVDVEEVAEDLLMDLVGIDQEEVWDNSGSTRYGYVDPGETAMMLLEDLVEPQLEKMRRYHSLGMLKQEMLHCMGIISALYQFETESNDWATDLPMEVVDGVLNEWQGRCKDAKLKQEMEIFMTKIEEGNI